MDVSFESLLKEWERATCFHSSIHAIAAHPHCQVIVDHIILFLDDIIQELRREPSLYACIVLNEAFDIIPYPEQHAGDIVEMSAAWLTWAENYRGMTP